MRLITTFSILLWQDVKIAWRQRSDIAEPLLFFVLVICLFPLGLDPDAKQLQMLAPAIIWIAALLASILALNQLFRAEYIDGSLEQLALNPQPLVVATAAKISAHWLISGFPLICCAPIAGILLHLSLPEIKILLTSLLLGTPALSLIGSIAAGLTLGLGNSGLLLPLLILPLYTPTLIFATSSIARASNGLPATGALAWQGVILILACCLAPFATSAAIKIGVKG
jgi:heme exporter protein B